MTPRLATAADLPAVVAIYNASIPGGWSTADTRPVTVESRAAWFAQFTSERRPIWVVEVAGEVAAWAALSSFYAGRPAYDATAEVSLYVAPAHQRRGLGEALKRFVLGECPRLGVTTVLSFSFDHNEATRKLNARLGFVECGRLPGVAVVGGEPRGLVIALLRVAADLGGPGSGERPLPPSPRVVPNGA